MIGRQGDLRSSTSRVEQTSLAVQTGLPAAALASLSDLSPSPSQLTQLSSLTRKYQRLSIRLSEPLILESAREYAARHRKLPTAASTEPLSRCPAATWRRVNEAGIVGRFGLSPGRTLSAILAPLRQVSEESLRSEARAYFALHGKLPTSASRETIPGLFGDTWHSIDAIARLGGRGFTPGRSLAKILAPLRAELMPPASKRPKELSSRSLPLSERTIIRAARHHFRIYGKLPSHHTVEPIPSLPGCSWRAIDQAGFQGHRGLARGRTLAKILAPLREEFQIKSPLTPERILAATKKFFLLHGKLPFAECRLPVPTLPTSSWTGIATALRRGLRGLPVGGSLVKLMKPLRRELGLDKQLTESEIVKSARTFYSLHGKLPSQLTQEPVPGRPLDSWRKINAAGQLGIRGLRKGRTLPVILAPLVRELAG